MNPLALAGAALVGLSLGLTGAGGSIVTLPILVYLGGVPPEEAVGLSLFVVGVAALLGAVQRMRAGQFHGKAALLFVVSGMPGAVFGARLTPLVPPRLLMILFAVLMLIVAAGMISKRLAEITEAPDCQLVRCVLAGSGVGVLTGFMGVGGGFLLMPALIRFARLPHGVATGTSLAVIAFNSAAGFLAHLGGVPTRWGLALTFAAIAAVGVMSGNLFAARLPTRHLRQGFAAMVIVTGAIVLFRGGA
jgi:uncharacterized membrane protein YfcA